MSRLSFTQTNAVPFALANGQSFQLGTSHRVRGCKKRCLSHFKACADLAQSLIIPNAWGLDDLGRLVRVSTQGYTFDPRVVTGLQAGETLVGVDIRPATGQLYGLGSTSRLYLIDTNTAVATSVSLAPFTPALQAGATAFGFDFNPTVDRIRVVSNTGQNIRLNPNDGTVAGTDPNVAYAVGDPNVGRTPVVTAVAYTNSVPPPVASTTLYDIDTAQGVLATQNPTTGALTTVGSLGVTVGALAAFDIQPGTNLAYASLVVGGVTGLYSINLTTGAATLIRTIAGGLRSLALINPANVPTFLSNPRLSLTVVIDGEEICYSIDLPLSGTGVRKTCPKKAGIPVCPGETITLLATFSSAGLPTDVFVGFVGTLRASLELC